MTATRHWSLRVALRLLMGMAELNKAYGPLFTGALVVLFLLVVLAATTGHAWLIGVAAVLAIVMSVWVFRAGVEDIGTEADAKYDPLANERNLFITGQFERGEALRETLIRRYRQRFATEHEAVDAAVYMMARSGSVQGSRLGPRPKAGKK